VTVRTRVPAVTWPWMAANRTDEQRARVTGREDQRGGGGAGEALVGGAGGPVFEVFAGLFAAVEQLVDQAEHPDLLAAGRRGSDRVEVVCLRRA